MHSSFAYQQQKPVSLARISLLYIFAAIPQLVWPYTAFSYHDISMKYLELPVVGYSMLAIWVGTLICSVAMIFIGAHLFILSKRKECSITQSPSQVRRYKLIRTLLVLGVAIDLLAVFLLFAGENPLQDKSAIVFFSAVMGGRILQANLEAVLQYFNR